MSSVRDGRIEALLDTSVLIRFLHVSRCDLLGAHPKYVFTVPADVVNEITADYPHQQLQIAASIANKTIRTTTVDSMSELELAAKLKGQRLGPGECAAIAAAIHRGLPIAIQDKTAQKKGKKLSHGLQILTIEVIVVDLIVAQRLDVETADSFKARWETMRFKLPKFTSFRDLLPRPRKQSR